MMVVLKDSPLADADECRDRQNSSMPSDARSIALSRDGIGLVPEWLLSLESSAWIPISHPRANDQAQQ
jgi:hypothetical protein